MSFCSLIASGGTKNANSYCSPHGSWRTTRYLDADNSLFVLRCLALSLLCYMCTLLLLSLSPALSRISFSFLRRTATISHAALPPARFRRDARACASVFYYREPPTFFLSVFLFFFAATPRLTTLDRHVHDFRLPLVVAASFLPLLRIFTVLFSIV